MNLDYVALLEIREGRMIIAKASQSGLSETGTDSYCQIPNYSFIRFICSECFQYRGINTIIVIPARQTRSIERYSRGITSIYSRTINNRSLGKFVPTKTRRFSSLKMDKVRDFDKVYNIGTVSRTIHRTFFSIFLFAIFL